MEGEKNTTSLITVPLSTTEQKAFKSHKEHIPVHSFDE